MPHTCLHAKVKAPQDADNTHAYGICICMIPLTCSVPVYAANCLVTCSSLPLVQLLHLFLITYLPPPHPTPHDSALPSSCLSPADVASLQRADGAFCGDEWGEVDTRFTYGALLCTSILGLSHMVDVPKAVEFIMRCKNFDGGFGCTPGRTRVEVVVAVWVLMLMSILKIER